MTKSLTEQWKDGELPVGSYYINLVGDVERVDFFGGLEWERTKYFGIEEVLAPVPGYNEYNELVQKIHILNEQNTKQYNELCEEIKKNNILEKKLEIAKNALEHCQGFDFVQYALKEMEGVK